MRRKTEKFEKILNKCFKLCIYHCTAAQSDQDFLVEYDLKNFEFCGNKDVCDE